MLAIELGLAIAFAAAWLAARQAVEIDRLHPHAEVCLWKPTRLEIGAALRLM